MQIKKVVSAQKEKLQTILSPQEQALGEIIFNNGQCQVLAQSVSRFELIVADERENEIAEYSLNIESPEEEGDKEAGEIFRIAATNRLNGTSLRMRVFCRWKAKRNC